MTISFIFSILLNLSTAHAESIWPDISSPIPNIVENSSNDSALIIAIEKYTHIHKVEGAVQNGNDWHQYFRVSANIPEERIGYILNESAGKTAILQKARQLSESTPKEGKIWLIYIGHGATHKNEAIFLGVDTRATVNSFDEQLTQLELINILKEEHDVIAFIDTCFSGRSDDGIAFLQGTQFAMLTSIDQVPKATIFTAAEHNEYAGTIYGLHRPAFSYLALGALRGWADKDDNGVSLEEIHQYTSKTLQTLVQGRTQQPTFWSDGRSEYIATYGKEKGPDISKIVDHMIANPPPSVVDSQNELPSNLYSTVVIPVDRYKLGCHSDDEVCKQTSGMSKSQFYSVNKSFEIMTTEVSQILYNKIQDVNPSIVQCLDCPVNQVNYYQALQFANALSESEGVQACYKFDADVPTQSPDCDGWRLPTREEWEVAARGNSKYIYSGSDEIYQVSRTGNHSRLPERTKGLKHNSFGIYDMSGNVDEWVLSDIVDNKGLVCGGNFSDNNQKHRVTSCKSQYTGQTNYKTGFRLVKNIQ